MVTLQGRLGTLSTLSEVAELVASLDRRGHRELALAEAFEKRWDMIAAAMQVRCYSCCIAVAAGVLRWLARDVFTSAC